MSSKKKATSKKSFYERNQKQIDHAIIQSVQFMLKRIFMYGGLCILHALHVCPDCMSSTLTCVTLLKDAYELVKALKK
jgi:hypothetical protein